MLNTESSARHRERGAVIMLGLAFFLPAAEEAPFLWLCETEEKVGNGDIPSTPSRSSLRALTPLFSFPSYSTPGPGGQEGCQEGRRAARWLN